MATVARLNIEITASNRKAIVALNQTQAAMAATTKSTQAATGATTAAGNAANLAGVSYSKWATATSQVNAQSAAMIRSVGALGAAGAFMIFGKAVFDAGTQFETAWTGVVKTVSDGQANIGPRLAELQQGIRDMAKEVPVAVTELSKIAALGGQLGVPIQDLEEFTRVVAELGVATNLSTEMATDGLARFTNITAGSYKEVGTLSDVIVELGNKTAATESEILAFSLRMAGAAHQAGFSQEEILGLGATMASLGLNSESAGSAISRAITRISKEVATGGSDLATFASISGMSAQQFADAWETRPAEALVAFIEGLNRIEESGVSTIPVLEEIGFTELRLADTIRRSTNAADEFGKIMHIAGDEAGYAGARSQEAERFFGTTAGQIQILKNNANDLAITLFGSLAPALNEVTGALIAAEPVWSAYFEGIMGKGNSGLSKFIGLLNPTTQGVTLLWSAIDEGKGTMDDASAAGDEFATAMNMVNIASKEDIAILAQNQPLLEKYADAIIIAAIAKREDLTATEANAVAQRALAEAQLNAREAYSTTRDEIEGQSEAYSNILPFIEQYKANQKALGIEMEGVAKQHNMTAEATVANEQATLEADLAFSNLNTTTQATAEALQEIKDATADLVPPIQDWGMAQGIVNDAVSQASSNAQIWEQDLKDIEKAQAFYNEQLEQNGSLTVEQQENLDLLNRAHGRVSDGLEHYNEIEAEAIVQHEKFRFAQDELNKQLDEGKISQEEYDAAMRDVTLAMGGSTDVMGELGRIIGEDLTAAIADLIAGLKDLTDNEWKPEVDVDAEPAKGNIGEVQTRLEDLDAMGVTADVYANIGPAEAELDRLLGIIRSGATLPISITGATTGMMASGGVSEGGMYLVGEEGAELVFLPKGAEVIPNDKTRKLLGGLADGTLGSPSTAFPTNTIGSPSSSLSSGSGARDVGQVLGTQFGEGFVAAAMQVIDKETYEMAFSVGEKAASAMIEAIQTGAAGLDQAIDAALSGAIGDAGEILNGLIDAWHEIQLEIARQGLLGNDTTALEEQLLVMENIIRTWAEEIGIDAAILFAEGFEAGFSFPEAIQSFGDGITSWYGETEETWVEIGDDAANKFIEGFNDRWNEAIDEGVFPGTSGGGGTRNPFEDFSDTVIKFGEDVDDTFVSLEKLFRETPTMVDDMIDDILKAVEEGRLTWEEAMQLMALGVEEEITPALEKLERQWKEELVRAIIEGDDEAIASLTQLIAWVESLGGTFNATAEEIEAYNKALQEGIDIAVSGPAKMADTGGGVDPGAAPSGSGGGGTTGSSGGPTPKLDPLGETAFSGYDFSEADYVPVQFRNGRGRIDSISDLASFGRAFGMNPSQINRSLAAEALRQISVFKEHLLDQFYAEDGTWQERGEEMLRIPGGWVDANGKFHEYTDEERQRFFDNRSKKVYDALDDWYAENADDLLNVRVPNGYAGPDGGQMQKNIDKYGATPFPFALGGLVTSPTMGLVGEAGTEGIIPFKHGGARIMAEEIAKAMKGFMPHGDGRTVINIGNDRVYDSVSRGLYNRVNRRIRVK